MDKILAWLRNYGLHSSEIKVYIDILTHPSTKVADIQKRTGLVRTTLYHTLASLTTKGLVSETTNNNVRRYSAADPKTFAHNIERDIESKNSQLSGLEEILELFPRPGTGQDTSAQVEHFRGTTAVKNAIDQALRCSTKKWYIIAPRNNFVKYAGKDYARYFMQQRGKRQIVAKSLWEKHEAWELTNRNMLNRNPRFLPDSFNNKFRSLVIIYDDNVLFIEPADQKDATCIRSSDISRLMKLMFDAIWQVAEEIDPLPHHS